MNENHGLTPENLLRTLPDALRNDESMAALAESIAGVLADRPGEIRNLLIYSRIDQLPEDLLDILAHDFKVDWWDGDYSLEEKRRTLKDSWRVHRMLGTKAAVETAISAIYPETKVSEWFEYNGQPYHFKLLIDVTQGDVDPSKHSRVMDRVEFYKNLRSILDSVEYLISLGAFQNPVGALVFSEYEFSAAFSNARGGQMIFLDGSRALDGSWVLDQAFYGIGLSAFAVETGVRHSEELTGVFILDNLWALDGSVALDGSRNLDAQHTEEVI